MRGWINLTIRIAFACISAFMLWAGFPQVDQPVFVWIGLVPLLLVISNTGILSGFFLSLLTGMLFFLGIFDWILEVPGYTFLHHGLLAVYLGSYFAVFGLAFSFISKRRGLITALFAAPFLWVALEFVRSNLSFLALPWALLSHTQYRVPIVLQLVSLTGAYGLSFLIVMVNSAIVSILYLFFPFQQNESGGRFGSAGKKRCALLIAATLLLLIFTLVYGVAVIRSPIAGKSYKLALVQGNIVQSKKWDPKYAKSIMQIYSDLSQKAATHQPDLIVWPESATPRAIFHDSRLFSQVSNIAKSSGTYLLLGSSHPQKYKRPGTRKMKFVNSAFLISPERLQSKPQRYDKIRLFPFGEYLPYEEVLPWSYIDVPKIANYIAGENYTIFKHPEFDFGVTICWENMFPQLFRRFVKEGAQFMVNITNEAWFGKTTAPYQFLSMSVIRAVENRIFLVRCANTGISCFIDPYGRVLDRVRNRKGEDIFVRGIKTAEVIPVNHKTFYTRYGDWVAWLSIFLSAGVLIIAIIKKKQKHLSISM